MKKPGQDQEELEKLRQRLSELEILEHKYRRVEADLRRQNDFFYQVLESLTHPFYVLDAYDYTIIVANSASGLGNLAPKPTCYGLTHRRAAPCDGLDHVCPLQVVKKTKKPVNVEHIHFDKDGNPRNVEVHAYPILDEHGNVVQMIEYLLDITDHKKLEKEIQDYAEKIKLFAYSMSHDLKNPLIAINGLIKLIDQLYADRLDWKGKEICGQIIKESKQTLSLIEEIYELIKTKETPFNFEELDPLEIIGQVREEFGKAITSRQINWSQPEFIPGIKAAKFSLLRVFRNLVDNALKHGGDELGEIEIGYRESSDHYIFSVSDDGAGIDEKDLEKLFGTFQRGPQAQGREGLGLGLAIVKEIAERHGGRAWGERRPGKGVSFFISLAKNL
jgi:signal transduction histidine kinase